MKNRIRELRERMGITQEQLGVMAGTSRQAINAIETEKYEPSIWIAYNISRVFKVTIEEIFLFEESIKKLRSDSSKGRNYHGVKTAAV
jgi:putative transcriptional regulator